MRILVGAAELFGGLQPEDFRVCFREGANFWKALLLERHQPHEFDRVAFVAQTLLVVRFCKSHAKTTRPTYNRKTLTGKSACATSLRECCQRCSFPCLLWNPC